MKALREKRILKPCLAQESDISAIVRQLCSFVPFSLQPKLFQPDYVSSYKKDNSVYRFRVDRFRVAFRPDYAHPEY